MRVCVVILRGMKSEVWMELGSLVILHVTTWFISLVQTQTLHRRMKQQGLVPGKELTCDYYSGIRFIRRKDPRGLGGLEREGHGKGKRVAH